MFSRLHFDGSLSYLHQFLLSRFIHKPTVGEERILYTIPIINVHRVHHVWLLINLFFNIELFMGPNDGLEFALMGPIWSVFLCVHLHCGINSS